jgi:hypothetical protein
LQDHAEREPSAAAELVALAWERLDATSAHALEAALRCPPSSDAVECQVRRARIADWQPVLRLARQLDPVVRGEVYAIFGNALRAPLTTQEVIHVGWPEEDPTR